ncbi:MULTISPECIES: hypothetical protein [unclassified Mucilaginibacter]|uniref:hypothetical protein n=1 Tax=unclassified Mucilaginibacter TaxID=2617802 RepID=UPI002AC8CDB0|nr:MULTISPECIES: hypothetical protein [unclassified Mucilaginibacter]MEB0260295.1 hypothetical protein [Mucilaginibacter sp. 10I4]MEB0277294.1 hypothetical protein [Mucilaginibacter sp. 10B2]MEB0302144.1 hypothetical protein [Mucilaginibacter sp. 5C4]WPX25420.1 hypothetical protein RHM67_09100 [Mucilaginibacter sp. 5C4]
MVSETVGKLMEGLDNKSGKRAVKYSIAFDGVLPCHSAVFTSQSYGSEDFALPEVVMGHVKKESSHRNIYMMDRGLQSIRTMKAFRSNDITFICRAKENKKFVELESFVKEDQDLDLGKSRPKAFLYSTNWAIFPGKTKTKKIATIQPTLPPCFL